MDEDNGNDHEGAILAGYSAKDEQLSVDEGRTKRFFRHVDLCPRCDYERGALCALALSI